MEVVKDTLAEIGANNKTVINVFNKVDMLEDKALLDSLKNEFRNSVFISASKGININSLLEKIKDEFSKDNEEHVIRLKPDEHKKVSMIYKLAEVKDVKYLKRSIKVTLRTNESNYSKLKTLV